MKHSDLVEGRLGDVVARHQVVFREVMGGVLAGGVISHTGMCLRARVRALAEATVRRMVCRTCRRAVIGKCCKSSAGRGVGWIKWGWGRAVMCCVAPVEYRGRVPARSVVIPGSYTKKFPAGEYAVGCALIIGQRKASTDLKTSLNEALRDFAVSG